MTLNFKCQDGSSLQVVVQKGVLDCISFYQTQFKMPKRRSFQVFSYEGEAGATCEKALLLKTANYFDKHDVASIKEQTTWYMDISDQLNIERQDTFPVVLQVQ